MRRVRAKVAHTIEPGCRYVHAGEEIDILDDQFDEAVHEHLQPHKPAEPGVGHLVLPQGVDTPPRPKPGAADLELSTPAKPDPEPYVFKAPGPHPDPTSPEFASTPARQPYEAPLSSPTPPVEPGSVPFDPDDYKKVP
jgi:hypothetical protein